MIGKQPDDPIIAHGSALVEETRRHAEDIRKQVAQGWLLVEETRQLLGATKPKGSKPKTT